ncbi:MAG: suppressor of fused domain protein [Acidobacteria bacterium]|nr:suppressor of fused domain protein [Acidobacteriota bacterium]
MPCDAFQGGPGREFSSVLLVSAPPGAPTLHMPSFRGDPVSLLWLVPITDSERLLAQEQGSVALVQRLWAAGNSWDFRPRHSVA